METFSTRFKIAEGIFSSPEGPADVSLQKDSPYFIDPMLIFKNNGNSPCPGWYDHVTSYLAFLKSVDWNEDVKSKNAKFFLFNEVKQTWMGMAMASNIGHGLASDFSKFLHKNLTVLLENHGVNVSIHIEKLALLRGAKLGKDLISDLMANILLKDLALYTQQFTKTHLPSECMKEYTIEVFDYEKMAFEKESFVLPINTKDKKNGYILLVPKCIVRSGESEISKLDLKSSYMSVFNIIDNEGLRDNLAKTLDDAAETVRDKGYKKNKKPGFNQIESEQHKAFLRFAEVHPVILDYYLEYKEQHINDIAKHSRWENEVVDSLFKCADALSSDLESAGFPFTQKQLNYNEAQDILNGIKKVATQNGGGKYFLLSGNPITTESDLGQFSNLVWRSFSSSGLGVKKSMNYEVEIKLARHYGSSHFASRKDSLRHLALFLCYNHDEQIDLMNQIRKKGQESVINKTLFIVEILS